MKNIFVALGIVMVIGFAWFFLRGSSLSSVPGLKFLMGASAVTPSTLTSDTPYIGSPLTKGYTDDTYHFSLSMPEDFNAQVLPFASEESYTVVLQNSKGEGIQILVTPNQGDARMLTAADVRAAITDMQVSDEEVVEIGADHRGVAFKSDNDAFSGASREVWFYFRGNLYQISTYARLDPLLKAMFATWKFY